MVQKEIHHEVVLTHSPETTYQLLTKPRLISQWFCEAAKITPDGFHIWQTTADGKCLDFHTTILDSVRNRWVITETDDERMLKTRYDIYPEADHQCRIEIVETGFTDDEFGNHIFQERTSSWKSFLQRLQSVSVFA